MNLENIGKSAPKPAVFNGCVQLSVNIESTYRAVFCGLPRKIAARKANGLADGWKTHIGPKRGCNLIPALSKNAKELRYAY